MKLLKSGSYLLNKVGLLTDVILHVPSTTYVNRGIQRLCPTDAEFLMSINLIKEPEALSILYNDLLDYCNNLNIENISIIDLTNYAVYAELRFAQAVRDLLFKYRVKSKKDLEHEISSVEPFAHINDKWYPYLINSYVKVSRFNNVVEFRISSEDGFDWNKVIVDEVILNDSYGLDDCRFTITRESSKGYKAYFVNATKQEILENDKVVLSSTYTRRAVIDGNLEYVSI